jgi:hypothetical protein
MKAFVRPLMATVLLSVFLAALLSFIPLLMQKDEGDEIAVFQPFSSTLTHNNLVDFLLHLTITSTIRHVDLQDDRLIIELFQADQRKADLLYRDCFLLLKGSLVSMKNINEVKLIIQLAKQPKIEITGKPVHLKLDPKMEKISTGSYQTYLKAMFEWKEQE